MADGRDRCKLGRGLHGPRAAGSRCWRDRSGDRPALTDAMPIGIATTDEAGRMSQADKDKRRSPRFEFECSVLIQVSDDLAYFSFMENISAAGCCIHRPKNLTILARGTQVKLFHNLGRGRSEAVPSTVVWSNENFLGFEYGSPQTLPPELLLITVGHDDD
jgi:hypothetical protein